MNIVLAEVQSLKINLSESNLESGSEPEDFSGIIRGSLQEFSRDEPQVVDNTQLNSSSTDVYSDETAIAALSWLTHLSSAKLSVTTDSQALTTSEASILLSGLQSGPNSNVISINPDRSITNLGVGELAPLDGKLLPPASDENGKPILADSLQMLRTKEAPVMPSIDLSQELDSRESRDRGLTQGVNRLLAQGIEQNSLVNFDKLSESVSPKALDAQSGSQALPEVAMARQLVVSPVGAVTGLQVNNPLTAIPEPLNIARPDSPTEWSQALGERVSWMINQKLNSAILRLDPPSLGKLEIYVRVTDEATNVTINTQSAQTRELIDNASARLRDVLQEAGYQNVNVDVGQDKDQPQPDENQIADMTEQSEDKADPLLDQVGDMGSETGHYFRTNTLVDFFA